MSLLPSVTGILRRCNRTGTFHPNTITSLKNIMHTKMVDYGSGSIPDDRRSLTDEEDWFIGHTYEPIYSLHKQEATTHKGSVDSSSASFLLENDLNSSISPLSCSSTTQISIDSELEVAYDIESGIFELEL